MAGPREACGVFAIFGDDEAALKTYWGIFSLQHRGQESAGIAVVGPDGDVTVHKGMGLVTEVLRPEVEAARSGRAALGHVRYSTFGESTVINAQPLLMRTRFGPLALAHNGNVVNAPGLKAELERAGAVFQGTTDSEVLAHLIARSRREGVREALLESLGALQGGFAFGVLTRRQIFAARDPLGIRPLVLGRTDRGAVVVASETCALDTIGAHFEREVAPGELLEIGPEGVLSFRFAPVAPPMPCAFEVIYFARADSRIDGRSAHVGRRALGHRLAEEAPVPADVVVGVPDSSLPAAMGYAETAGIPFDFGLVKNRYIARTFIAPRQQDREMGVQLKLSAVPEVVRNRRVVLVDDSLVRGTTSRRLVQLLREAGAREVHMRIASPPYTHPCHYGIDTSRATELAARNMSVEEVRAMVGADTLAYLSLDGLKAALGEHRWCLACFGGGYPVPVPGVAEPATRA
ncbi:MAG: amidophosphoribosyltransferase [Firmicutes bacterium]|nr:amidophosphoribosyltransferase [Alicyclobacillaceae bacterium]MCL6497911.1 amidophosphoribosyltransferase [Bacillota bacterium]